VGVHFHPRDFGEQVCGWGGDRSAVPDLPGVPNLGVPVCFRVPGGDQGQIAARRLLRFSEGHFSQPYPLPAKQTAEVGGQVGTGAATGLVQQMMFKNNHTIYK